MARERHTAVPAALAVVVLGAVAAVAAHIPAAHPAKVIVPRPGDVTAGALAVRAPPPPQAVPWWLVVIGMVALVAVVGPLLWLALKHGLGRRAGPDVVEPAPRDVDVAELGGPLPDTDDALADAVDALDAGGDPREVVIACWVRLEAAADASGRGRRPAETATDVARRWLGRADSGPDDRAAVDELAALFHEARYSRHAVTDDQRGRARHALAALLGARA